VAIYSQRFLKSVDEVVSNLLSQKAVANIGNILIVNKLICIAFDEKCKSVLHFLSFTSDFQKADAKIRRYGHSFQMMKRNNC